MESCASRPTRQSQRGARAGGIWCTHLPSTTAGRSDCLRTSVCAWDNAECFCNNKSFCTPPLMYDPLKLARTPGAPDVVAAPPRRAAHMRTIEAVPKFSLIIFLFVDRGRPLSP